MEESDIAIPERNHQRGPDPIVGELVVPGRRFNPGPERPRTARGHLAVQGFKLLRTLVKLNEVVKVAAV